MPHLGAIKRRDLIAGLHALGFAVYWAKPD
jgi:hypothetical protein